MSLIFKKTTNQEKILEDSDLVLKELSLFNQSQVQIRLQAERTLAKNIDGGFYYGLAMVICQLLILIPALSAVMWIASIVLWILCWTKVVESKALIIA